MGPESSYSSTPPAETPVTAAIKAGQWIRSAAVDDERGRHWRANPDPRRRSARSGQAASLYAGAAGIVLFFLELAAATGHEAYLEDAGQGARFLAATWRQQTDLSLYHGLSGMIFALAEAGWATGEERFEVEARAAADHVVRSLRRTGDGIGWTGDPAQRGDGGIILALLHAAGILGVSAYEEVAVEAGAHVARQVIPGHRFGADGCPDLPADAVTPGFLSGTAGTAFLLARLYGVTGDRCFLDAARRGADFVRTVSVVGEQHVLVPHHLPQGRHLHYLGLCSGSAGVARMFYELYRVTGDQGDLDWAERLAAGILRIGAPHRQTPGFWNVACQCCGSAGLLELFVGLWAATGAEPHLRFAHTVAGHLITGATGQDRAGYRWYQAYRRLCPRQLSADTGYMIGAAGIGSALLHLDATGRGDDPRRLILLPDNPFPAIALPASALRRSG